MSTTSVPAAASLSVTKRKGIRPPLSRTRRSLAGLASTAVTDPARSRATSNDRGADQLVHPELPGDLDRLGLELHPAQALGL